MWSIALKIGFTFSVFMGNTADVILKPPKNLVLYYIIFFGGLAGNLQIQV